MAKPDEDILSPLQVCSHPQTNICMCGTGSVSPGIKRIYVDELDFYVPSFLNRNPITKLYMILILNFVQLAINIKSEDEFFK